MSTYLELLPDDLYIKNFQQVHRPTLQSAAKKGNRKQIKKQGHKTNHNVVQAWMNDKPFKSLRMSTDGKDLFSYNLCIGDTDPTTDGKILRDWTTKGIGYWSQTTSTHVNLARRFVDKVCNGT